MDPRIVTAVKRDGIERRLRDIFVVCFDQIVERKISTIAELHGYLDELGWHPKLESVVSRCHALLREMHWGLFRDLEPEAHPELWKILTVRNRTTPRFADLKEDVLVPNLFVAMLDIHDYTDFCQRHRDNTSMLRTLDRVIHHDMAQIARKYGCLSSRAGGDMIILLGASAASTLRACLGIVDCFSRKRLLKAAALSENRTGKSFLMDDFHVAGGIAGGQHYSSVIITQGGDISGAAVNTAARLQGFAGAVAPKSSKLMLTSHVYEAIHREGRAGTPSSQFAFFDCGQVGFKGTDVRVHELLFTEREIRKVRYQEAFTELQSVASRGIWTDDLVPQTARLLARVLETSPVRRTRIAKDQKPFTNGSLVKLCLEAARRYEEHADHRTVSALLNTVLGVLRESAEFDPLVLAHAEQIAGAYEGITREFESIQVERILENQTSLFSASERAAIDHAARLERIRETLIERGKANNNIYSPALLWNKIVTDFEGGWEHRIHSGKR